MAVMIQKCFCFLQNTAMFSRDSATNPFLWSWHLVEWMSVEDYVWRNLKTSTNSFWLCH